MYTPGVLQRFGEDIKTIRSVDGYDFSKKQLKIGEKYISFKSAKKQRDFLEMLIKNSARYITGTELETTGITNMKSTLDDLKNKLKESGVTSLERKQLFNYFEEKGEKYCRILL